MSIAKIDLNALTKPHWTDSQKEKAKLVVNFVQLIMNDHNFDEVISRFGQQEYKQHNRTIEDGISGVVKTIKDLTKTSPEFSYDVKHIYVDGEHVILHSHATLKTKHRGNEQQGFNIIDTWKVQEGKLVEHWDTIQGLNFSMRLYVLMVGGKVRNENGVF